jgi:LCP family protein required for cell wall assembly
MPRRILAVALALGVVISACTGSSAPTTTTTTTTEPTTTTTQPTTTTTAPFVVEGADPRLTELVEDFYAYAAGTADVPPTMPAELLASITPAPAERPDAGIAANATFKGQMLATVQVGNDLFLAVEDESGWRIVGGEWPDIGVDSYYGSGPRLIAVVGSDARTGQPVDATRADSIHFVALDGLGAGAVVGLPRDSYVPVPGYGTRKITGSLALGGPEVMVASFLNLTELPLEGYVLTGFAGFQGLVEILGGIEVEVPFAINDVKAKAALTAGLQILNGFDALAFARARKTVPGGDFTRSEHQGALLVAAAQGVRGMGPLAIPGLMEAAEPQLMTDLSAEQLLTFSVLATKSNLDEMPNLVAPGSPGWAGSASVVYLHDAAYSIFADLADGRLDD